MNRLSNESTDTMTLKVNYTYPAGKYYIGDICYALSEDVYDKQWGDKFNYACGTHEMTSQGVSDVVSVNYTTYGDGVYTDTFNNIDFEVDSGTIGIVPIALCDPNKVYDDKIKGGLVIKSISPINFKSNDGIFEITFNYDIMTILIDTNDVDE